MADSAGVRSRISCLNLWHHGAPPTGKIKMGKEEEEGEIQYSTVTCFSQMSSVTYFDMSLIHSRVIYSTDAPHLGVP